jgi:hypothetical protein
MSYYEGMKAFPFVPLAAIIREYSPGIGRHWFDRDTLRFFACRLSDGGRRAADGSIYFVTSEKGSNGIRAYSVRRLFKHTDGRMDIDTVGEFQAHATRAAAYGKVLRMLRLEAQAVRA